MMILNLSGESNTDEPFEAYKGSPRYKPPQHSESFLEHLKNVKQSWPYEETLDVDPDDTGTDGVSQSKYAVSCTGEPSIDPRRQIQSVLDGESDWI